MPSLLARLLGDDEPDEQVDLERRQSAADTALSTRVDPAGYGIIDAGVTGVAVVNEGPEGEPIVVPIARFALGEDVESPDADLVWELVGDAVRALYDPFEDVFVRHYDVQFTFDGDELFEAEQCRRVAVSRALAARTATEPTFGTADLREAMFEAHDIDDGVAPVAWGQPRDYAEDATSAVVTTAAAGATAASCAGAGAGGCY
ncbi:MAG: hypothetical protein ABEJ79_10580 [Halolamina sp.]